MTTTKERYNLIVTDVLLRRNLTVLTGVTPTDKARVEKYLVGENWKWVKISAELDN